MANFQLSNTADQAKKAAEKQAADIAAGVAARGQKSGALPTDTIYTPDEIKRSLSAENKARDIESSDQARRGGVDTASANMGAGGIAQFFDPNAKVETTHYTAGHVDNTSLASNRALLDKMAGMAMGRGSQTMQGATMGPGATIATAAQDQTRARQNALLDQLMAASNGQGPSAAQQQPKMGADRNMAAALSAVLTTKAIGPKRSSM